MTTPQPWICPRCATVNAPHVNQCTCRPVQAQVPTIWINEPNTQVGSVTISSTVQGIPAGTVVTYTNPNTLGRN